MGCLFAMQQAISDVTSASISKRGQVRSLCYEIQFSFILKLELIAIAKISHLDSLWKKRLKGTRKWPIIAKEYVQFNFLYHSNNNNNNNNNMEKNKE